MKILGIDPGYERLGIAVIETSSSTTLGTKKPQVVFSKCFKTSTKDDHSKRLFQIQKEIESVIKKFKPEKIVIETLFFNKNIKTAIKVAEARGIILACAEKYGVKINEVSPQQIKIAVTGYGKSDKKAVEKMIPLLVSFDDTKRNGVKLDDELDAIAAALTVPDRD